MIVTENEMLMCTWTAAGQSSFFGKWACNFSSSVPNNRKDHKSPKLAYWEASITPGPREGWQNVWKGLKSSSMWKLPHTVHSHKHSYKYVYIYERFIFMNTLLLHFLPSLLHKVKRKAKQYWSLSDGDFIYLFIAKQKPKGCVKHLLWHTALSY